MYNIFNHRNEMFIYYTLNTSILIFNTLKKSNVTKNVTIS